MPRELRLLICSVPLLAIAAVLGASATGFDRHVHGNDRRTHGIDRRTIGAERRTLGAEQGATGSDRQYDGAERRTLGAEQGATGSDRQYDGADRRATLARIDSLWEAGAGLTARGYIRHHIERARACDDSLFLLNLLCREGRLLAALNLSIEAEPFLREGLRLAVALNEPLLQRTCLRWLGVALIGRGRLQQVQDCFGQLLRLSQESGDRYHEGYAWMGSAYYDWQSGMAQDARDKYTRSVRIFQEIGQVRGELWALIGLNNALTTLGAYAESISGNRRIVAIGRENGLLEVEALGHNNLGVLLFSLGDTGEALAHFQRAAELQQRNGNVRETLIAGQNICICEIALGRTRESSRRLRDLLETSREYGYVDVQASLLVELADAHLHQGNNRLAARLFREALSLTEGLNPKEECEAVTGLSETMARMDNTRTALALLRSQAAAMLALEDARMQFTFRNEMAERLLDENLPGEAFEMAMTVEKRGAGLGLTAHRLEALPLAARAALALGRPDSALVLLQRGVQLWEKDRGLPLDPEWREQRGAAARKLFTQLTWLILHHPGGLPPEQRVREAFDALQAYKARTLLERMLGPGGRKVPVLQASPVTLDELQGQVLLPGEVLLDFVVGAEHTLLFACTLRESRALVLPGETELNHKLRLFHELLATRPPEPLSAAERESIDSAARNLAEVLFSSCADMIAGARHVIVVPDGALNLLPLPYLLHMDFPFPVKEQAGGPPSNPQYNGRTVSRIPAATVLAWLRKKTERGGEAQPVSGRILALAGRATEPGEILPGTMQEISLLARRYGGITTQPQRVTTVPEGTASTVFDSTAHKGTFPKDEPTESLPAECELSADAFTDFDILHFAAHSTVDDQSPWQSAIYLGTEADGSDRTVLRAYEIAAWKLPARLVVLSSCESAGGRILCGEGVQGLTSAFLSAGVRSVVATLWPVDDEVTVDFMADFYEALKQGASVSASLESARSILRGRPRTAHPFYWAGFVLVGEGELRVDLQASPGRRWPLWTTALLVSVIVWLTIEARRKKYRRSR